VQSKYIFMLLDILAHKNIRILVVPIPPEGEARRTCRCPESQLVDDIVRYYFIDIHNRQGSNIDLSAIRHRGRVASNKLGIIYN
jgi:hypothetical protein